MFIVSQYHHYYPIIAAYILCGCWTGISHQESHRYHPIEHQNPTFTGEILQVQYPPYFIISYPHSYPGPRR